MSALSISQLEGMMKELALFLVLGTVLAFVTFKILEIIFSLWGNTRKYKKALYNRLFHNWISEAPYYGCLFQDEGKWYEASLFNEDGFSPRIHLTISCYVEGEVRVIHGRPIVWLFRRVNGKEVRDKIQELKTIASEKELIMVTDLASIRIIENSIREAICRDVYEKEDQ